MTLAMAGAAQAATITLNFESATVGSTAPTGWQLAGSGTGTYATTTGTGNPGQSGNFSSSTGARYLVNSGIAFDATQAISGSFDFYVVENGNYSNARFWFGDVQNGITGVAAGEFIAVDLREKTFGARANLLDGAGATIFDGSGNNSYEILTNTWNRASFTWTPTSDTTGDFSFSWVRPTNINEGPMTVTGFSLDSASIYFGFGTTASPVYFDNISITGNTLIPEPSITLLGGIGLLLLLRRRPHS